MKTVKHIICLLCMMAYSTGIFGQGYGMYLNGEYIYLDDGDNVTFSEDASSGETKVTVNKDGVVTVYEGGDISFFGNIERYFQDMLSAMHLTNILSGDRHYDWGYGSLMVIRDAMTADVGRQGVYNQYSYWSGNQYQGNNYVFAQYCWNYYQTAVDRTNELIRALRQIKDKNDVQRGYLAAAYAFRALFYLDMVRMWEFLPNDATYPVSLLGGDVTNLTVPIVTDEDERDPVSGAYPWTKKFRAPRDEAFAFIKSDIEKAESDIEKSGLDTKTVPDLTAVYGLKSRLYMWMEDYANAQYWAEKAIATGKHTPLTKSEILDDENGFNSLEPASWLWGAQPKENPTVLLCWTSWMSNEAAFGYAYLCNVRISPYLYDRIGNGDVRKQLFKVTGDEPHIMDDNAFAELLPYSSLKFRPYVGNADDYQVGGIGAFPIMRIEEMYLIQAEAMAQQGNVTDAQNLLNSFVKNFRNPDYSFTTTSKEQLIDEIFLQKQIELWGEGQIFFDYKRLNKPVDRVSHSEDMDFWEVQDRLQSTTRPAWMNLVFPRTTTMANMYNNPDPSGLYLINGGVERSDRVSSQVSFIDGFMSEHFLPGKYFQRQETEVHNYGNSNKITISKPFEYLRDKVSGLDVGDGGNLEFRVDGLNFSIPYQYSGLTYNGQVVYIESTADGTYEDDRITFPRNSIVISYGGHSYVSNTLGSTSLMFADQGISFFIDADFYENDYHGIGIPSVVTEGGQQYMRLPVSVMAGAFAKIAIVDSDSMDSTISQLMDDPGFGTRAEGSGYVSVPFSCEGELAICYVMVMDNVIYLWGSRHIAYPDYSISASFYGDESQISGFYLFGAHVDKAFAAIVSAEMTEDEISSAFYEGRIEWIKELPLNHQSYMQEMEMDKPDKDGTYSLVFMALADEKIVSQNIAGSFTVDTYWTQWQPWGEGTGTYTYCNAWSGTDPGLKIYYRESRVPGDTKAQFRIDNWGGGVSLCIDYDKATNQCYIAEQYTGADYSDGSQILAADFPTWQGNEALRAAGYDSYYDPETGLFTLHMAYYCAAGTFGWDPEYFQCDGFYQPDYEVHMAYKGEYSDADGKTGAIVSFIKGVDVASYKYVVLEGKYAWDQAEQLAAIIDADKEGKYGAITSDKDGDKIIELQSDGDYTVATANYDADGNLVGGSVCAFTYEAPGGAQWESIGMCRYTDDIIAPLFQAAPVPYDVEVRVNADKPGIYRMVNPYGASFPYNEEGDYDASKDYFIDINATDPDGVYIKEQETGCDWGYGNMSIMSIGYYYMAGGNSFEDVKAAGYMGTLKDNVITFPVKGLAVADDDGIYYANNNGAFALNLNPANAKTRTAKAHVSVSKNLKADKSVDLKMTEYRKAVNVHVYNISSEQVWKGLQLRKDVKL